MSYWPYGTYNVKSDMAAEVQEDFKSALGKVAEILRIYLENSDDQPTPEAKILLCWNNRLQITAGQCKVTHRQEYKLNGSKRLYLAFQLELNYNYLETFGVERVNLTMRHELAHIVEIMLDRARGGHSLMWQKVCQALGGSIATNQGSPGVANVTKDDYLARKPPKHCYKCPYCGREHWRYKRMSTRMQTKRCGFCGTRVLEMIHHKI